MRTSLLPRSLHSRILAAFVAVILLTLVAAGSGVVWVIQAYRTQLSIDHFSELTAAASLASRQLERQEARPEEIAAFVSNLIGRTDVRVLVLDSAFKVVAERPAPANPDLGYGGRRVELPPPGQPNVRSAEAPGRSILGVRTRVWLDGSLGPRSQYILLTPSTPNEPPNVPGPGLSRDSRSGNDAPRPEGLERFISRQPVYRIILAVPSQNLGSAWRELFPRLTLAALIALVASAAAAWWLARSIARPLRRITSAAEEMARGALRQSIPVEGSDEVAHLAVAFNAMSREVEHSHRALRDFLANASHELRTPLTSIQGFSQALLEGALLNQDGAMEAGKIINEEAERMRKLVEDLLYLSRVESAKVPAHAVPVDVAALLREESRRLTHVAEQRGLQLNLEVGALPPVMGDADELDRLLGNLLENAGKYTPEGGTITVRATSAAEQIQVAVHNTGIAIPDEDQPRIFERFYRVEKSRARDVEGSGLGLAIAREVAQQHGGAIAVTSDPEHGTTFTVTLPVASAAAARSQSTPGTGELLGRSGDAELAGPSRGSQAPAAV